jgi:signal transduction histidine kinase
MRRIARGFRLFLVETYLAAVQLPSLIGQLVSAAPASVVMAQILAIGLAAFCFWLNRLRRTTAASLVYITISAVSVLFASLQGSASLDGLGLVILSILSLFIVLTGLVLPRGAIWLVAAGIMLAVAVTVASRPVAAGLVPNASAVGGEDTVRFVLIGVLGVAYLSVAILTWIFARSSYAGLLAVVRAFEQERELAALKDQFIVDANHELRTPMMALYGNLELALAVGDDERTVLLRRALYAGDAVLGMLSSVLDVGVLQAGRFVVQPRPVRLRPLVLAVLETFDPHEIGEPSLEAQRASARAVTVEIDAEVEVQADEMRLRQVFVNLLSNALKYSAPGTPIEVRASMGEAIHVTREGAARAPATGQMLIGVRDYGLGVPPRDASLERARHSPLRCRWRRYLALPRRRPRR